MPTGIDPSRGNVVVRPLEWRDFDDLTDVYYLLYEERARGEPIGITLFGERPTRADEVTWFTGLYRDVLAGNTIAMVAERGGHAIGSCIVGRQGARPDAENGHVGVLGLLVHRDHRGIGAGTALLRATLARCHGVFEIVRLTVFATNTGAKRLYAAFGFRDAGRIPRAIRRNGAYFDEDLMVLVVDDGRSSKPHV